VLLHRARRAGPAPLRAKRHHARGRHDAEADVEDADVAVAPDALRRKPEAGADGDVGVKVGRFGGGRLLGFLARVSVAAR